MDATNASAEEPLVPTADATKAISELDDLVQAVAKSGCREVPGVDDVCAVSERLSLAALKDRRAFCPSRTS
jgi:hypothetical protein